VRRLGVEMALNMDEAREAGFKCAGTLLLRLLLLLERLGWRKAVTEDGETRG
jgi:hypothetical protein